eukprot:15064540-Alexandrium_andersonii.AAC.1
MDDDDNGGRQEDGRWRAQGGGHGLRILERPQVELGWSLRQALSSAPRSEGGLGDAVVDLAGVEVSPADALGVHEGDRATNAVDFAARASAFKYVDGAPGL